MTTREMLDDVCFELQISPVVFDGLDEAIVGYGSIYTGPEVVVYDEEKILECLKKQGMSEEDASEWYNFNIACLYAGPETPFILKRLQPEGDARPACPYCGNTAPPVEHAIGSASCRCVCSRCGAAGPRMPTKGLARKAWETRDDQTLPTMAIGADRDAF